MYFLAFRFNNDMKTLIRINQVQWISCSLQFQVEIWNFKCNKTNEQLIFAKNNDCSSCPTKTGKNNCHILISFIIYEKHNDLRNMKKKRNTRHGINKIKRCGTSIGLSQY